ncbi:MAG TPA: LytTR family DNA-binding domain-containing protein [Burkholderiaceae bacterium]|nr:LytTR family DNA-binding domain-containing protein [Burkholderiaceae bacterium]
MTDALRVLLVDDEEPARLRLRSLLGECLSPRAEVVGEASNAAQALAWLAEHDCDLLLLDIGMPGKDGVALATELKQRAPAPAVVFVTAHAEHALDAFELNAVDYLTKPVRRARLVEALQRAVHRRAPRAHAPAATTEPPVIVVTELGRVVRVPLHDVLYLKAELKYVTLRTAERTHVLDEALADLESRLGERFLRVHRNALVARRALRALERRSPGAEIDDEGADGWAVRVAPVNEWLAVSRRQLAAVREAMRESGSS